MADRASVVRADALAYIEKGYHRFKLYARRMLKTLDISGAAVSQPLLEAARIIEAHQDAQANFTAFLHPRSKWKAHFSNPEINTERFWFVAVLFHLREAFRSGDIWLTHSHRYHDIKQALVPVQTAQTMGLSMPLDPHIWLEDRKKRLENGLMKLAGALKTGVLPDGTIQDGKLQPERLEADVPDEADALILDLYRRLPETRITDILIEVDKDIGFTESFTHLRTGASCKDPLGLLNVILAEGFNLGLSKMVAASSTHSFAQLARLSNWYVESENINRALAMVIEARSHLSLSQFWGFEAVRRSRAIVPWTIEAHKRATPKAIPSQVTGSFSQPHAKARP